jgi:AraC-like DNA-binding protein
MEDSTAFWRHPRFTDMDLLKARFTRFCYQLHTHPTYVIALITYGCERLRVGPRQEISPANTIIVVNPEECHDGEPGVEIGWAYRVFYPSVELMTDVARELGSDETPLFRSAVIDDPALARALAIAHRAAEHDKDEDAEASMLLAFGHMIAHYAARHQPSQSDERSSAGRRLRLYRDIIEGDISGHLDLRHLASAAGVTRFQVIRDFKRMTGLTPGAYIRNRRLRLASHLIEQGICLAEAAVESGFSDQSHLSRSFKNTHGITPRMFQRATLSAETQLR